MATVAAPSERVESGVFPKRAFADIAEQAWVLSIVGYTLLRFVVAWGAFSEHGANVWIFGLLDVGTAYPYAKGVAAVCRRAANAEWRMLPAPLAVSLVSFFAPYAYLWFAAGSMPDGVRVGLAICVTVLMLAATSGVLAKTRKLRREAHDAAADRASQGATVVASVTASSVGDVIDARNPVELLIDLTGDEVELERSRPSS